MGRSTLWTWLVFVPCLAGAAPTSPETIALTALVERRESLGLGSSALADVVVLGSQLSQPTKTTYVNLQQRLGGIEIIGATLTVAISREGQVLGLASRFVPDPGAVVDSEPLALSALQAVTRAAETLNLGAPQGLRVLEAEGKPDSSLLLTTGGIATSPISVRLRYQPTTEGRLRLVWEMVIDSEVGPQPRRVRVDAASGELIDRSESLVSSGSREPAGAPSNASPPPPLADARTIVVDPALGGHPVNGRQDRAMDAESDGEEVFERGEEPPAAKPRGRSAKGPNGSPGSRRLARSNGSRDGWQKRRPPRRR